MMESAIITWLAFIVTWVFACYYYVATTWLNVLLQLDAVEVVNYAKPCKLTLGWLKINMSKQCCISFPAPRRRSKRHARRAIQRPNTDAYADASARYAMQLWERDAAVRTRRSCGYATRCAYTRANSIATNRVLNARIYKKQPCIRGNHLFNSESFSGNTLTSTTYQATPIQNGISETYAERTWQRSRPDIPAIRESPKASEDRGNHFQVGGQYLYSLPFPNSWPVQLCICRQSCYWRLAVGRSDVLYTTDLVSHSWSQPKLSRVD